MAAIVIAQTIGQQTKQNNFNNFFLRSSESSLRFIAATGMLKIHLICTLLTIRILLPKIFSPYAMEYDLYSRVTGQTSDRLSQLWIVKNNLKNVCSLVDSISTFPFANFISMISQGT